MQQQQHLPVSQAVNCPQIFHMTDVHMVETVSVQILKVLIIINAAKPNALIVSLHPKAQLCMLPLYAETCHFQMLLGKKKS